GRRLVLPGAAPDQDPQGEVLPSVVDVGEVKGGRALLQRGGRHPAGLLDVEHLPRRRQAHEAKAQGGVLYGCAHVSHPFWSCIRLCRAAPARGVWFQYSTPARKKPEGRALVSGNVFCYDGKKHKGEPL